MRDPETDWEHEELPDHSDEPCRDSQCANSPKADRMARYSGELCDRCEARADRLEAEKEADLCPECGGPLSDEDECECGEDVG